MSEDVRSVTISTMNESISLTSSHKNDSMIFLIKEGLRIINEIKTEVKY